MNYIDKNLISGERVIYRTKLHWIIFTWPAILTLVTIAFLLLAVFTAYGKYFIYIAGFFFLLTIITGLSSFIKYSSSEFGVTNKRVLIKVGFISRHSLELLLSKVEGIGVDQGIVERIFNYGTITVTGTGGTKETFRLIPAPLDFRKRVQEQIVASQDAK